MNNDFKPIFRNSTFRPIICHSINLVTQLQRQLVLSMHLLRSLSRTFAFSIAMVN